MAAKVITEFKGHSGCGVYLMGKRENLFVRKTGNFHRNLTQLQTLADRFPVPKVFSVTSNHMDMEYIHGLDMRSFLISNPAEALAEFLIVTLTKLSRDSVSKDYTPVYQEFLDQIDFKPLPFTSDEFLDSLPRHLHASTYHGDLTLENLVYNTNTGFYMIDCSVGIWDSYIFDIAKLRQDLECRWFLRNCPAMLETKLMYIQDRILAQFPEGASNSLLILMLLRVMRYCQVGDINWKFLQKEIHRLWK